MKPRRKFSAFMAFAVTLAGFGLAGCGNSGEGQIKLPPDVRKNMTDDAPKTDGAAPANSSDGSKKSIKSRLGNNGEK